MDELSNVGALIGRILLVVIFVLSGFGKIMHFTNTEVMMAAQGIPATAVLLILSIVIELGGGLLIIVGFQTRWVALIMFLFLIPVTVIFHVQGYMHAAQMHQMQMALMQQINILKNLAIEGGLLVLASFGAGRYSIDGWV